MCACWANCSAGCWWSTPGSRCSDDVERLRELTIAGDGAAAEELVASWPDERAEDVARAFTCYFHLTNLSEELHRARVLRQRDREGDAPTTSELAQAVRQIADLTGEQAVRALLTGLEFRPVLTAHPTEARRRAVLATIRRISGLLEERADPRIGDAERRENTRRLLEQVDILWRTSQLRTSRPTPLDEVRSAMAVFEETLFEVIPSVYRRLDDALAGDEVGTKQPAVAPFVRLGSWIGGDRDGNPNVTAAITREAMQIQADHVLAVAGVGHRPARPFAHAGCRHHPAVGAGPAHPGGRPRAEPGADRRHRDPLAGRAAPPVAAAGRAPVGRHPGARCRLRLPAGVGLPARAEGAAGLLGVGGRPAAGVRRAAAADLAGQIVRVPPGRAGGPAALVGARQGPRGGARRW